MHFGAHRSAQEGQSPAAVRLHMTPAAAAEPSTVAQISEAARPGAWAGLRSAGSQASIRTKEQMTGESRSRQNNGQVCSACFNSLRALRSTAP